MPRPPTKRAGRKYTRCLSHGKNNKPPPPVDPVPEQLAEEDAYLSMNVPQLRRKVKALIGRINKNKKTIDGLKKERVDLQKAKSTREKKYKKDMDNHDCKLRVTSPSCIKIKSLRFPTFTQRTCQKMML